MNGSTCSLVTCIVLLISTPDNLELPLLASRSSSLDLLTIPPLLLLGVVLAALSPALSPSTVTIVTGTSHEI